MRLCFLQTSKFSASRFRPQKRVVTENLSYLLGNHIIHSKRILPFRFLPNRICSTTRLPKDVYGIGENGCLAPQPWCNDYQVFIDFFVHFMESVFRRKNYDGARETHKSFVRSNWFLPPIRKGFLVLTRAQRQGNNPLCQIADKTIALLFVPIARLQTTYSSLV